MWTSPSFQIDRNSILAHSMPCGFAALRMREVHLYSLNLAPFGRWTLRDKAAQRRLALR
jgi:hypothetical protein